MRCVGSASADASCAGRKNASAEADPTRDTSHSLCLALPWRLGVQPQYGTCPPEPAHYRVRPMSGWWLVIFLAIFLIGVTKSGFGSGVGLMIVPMTVVAMAHTRYQATAALGLMLPLLLAG